MEENLQTAFNELTLAFSQLSTEEKRDEIAKKINEMADTFNFLSPVNDLAEKKASYKTEDEYLCYLNAIIYNLENKLGNILKSFLE